MRDFLQCVCAVARSPLELSFRQVAVLMTCAGEDDDVERQIIRLSVRLGYSTPVISRAADKLEEAGLLERSALPGDKRTCVLTVTNGGHEFIQAVVGDADKVGRRKKAA